MCRRCRRRLLRRSGSVGSSKWSSMSRAGSWASRSARLSIRRDLLSPHGKCPCYCGNTSRRAWGGCREIPQAGSNRRRSALTVAPQVYHRYPHVTATTVEACKSADWAGFSRLLINRPSRTSNPPYSMANFPAIGAFAADGKMAGLSQSSAAISTYDSHLSLADLAAAGVELSPVEAVTIVRDVVLRASRGELPGVPSAHVIRVSDPD